MKKKETENRRRELTSAKLHFNFAFLGRSAVLFPLARPKTKLRAICCSIIKLSVQQHTFDPKLNLCLHFCELCFHISAVASKGDVTTSSEDSYEMSCDVGSLAEQAAYRRRETLITFLMFGPGVLIITRNSIFMLRWKREVRASEIGLSTAIYFVQCTRSAVQDNQSTLFLV